MWQTIKAVLMLLPSIIVVVKEIEDIFPEGGQGQMKLALIVETLKNISDFSDDLLPTIEAVVDAVVGVFNRFGLFNKE